MSRPSLLEAPCYSEDFSDSPDVQVVYRCESRRSHRSAGGYGRLLVCHTEWTGQLLSDVSEERCPSHYIRNCRSSLDFGLKDECVYHVQGGGCSRMKEGERRVGINGGERDRQTDRTVGGTTDGKSGLDSGDQKGTDE